MVLNPRCGNAESLDSCRSVHGLYFEDIYDTLEREVMRSENKGMLGEERNAVDGQSFVGNVHILCDETASSSKCTALVSCSIYRVLMTFTY